MRNPRGVGERPVTAFGEAFVLASGVRIATVEGTLASGMARLFAESCRNGGLGRSDARGGSPPITFAAPTTAGVPWPPRRGTSSAHAFETRAQLELDHRCATPARASRTRPSLGPGTRQVLAERQRASARRPPRSPPRPARANLRTQEEPRRSWRNRRRRPGGSPVCLVREGDCMEEGRGPRPREDTKSPVAHARTSCFVAEVVRRTPGLG